MEHRPIELNMRIGRDWAKGADRKEKKSVKKAGIVKVRGQTKEVARVETET